MTDYTELHPGRAALLVIDMQSDFIDGVMSVPGTAEVVSALSSVIDAFRRAGRPIVHVVRYYPPGGSDVDTVRRSLIESGARIAVPGTPGTSIPVALTGGREIRLDPARLIGGRFQDVGPAEVVMYKPRWSAFHRTPLHDWLTAADVDSVIVAGCNLPNCPRATLFDASARDYRTGLVVDAVSGVTRERLDDLALIGVNLIATDELTSALHGLEVPG